MKSLSLIISLFFVGLALTTNAQSNLTSSNCDIFRIPQGIPFSECAAIFLNDKMLVDEYSPDGKCKLEEGMPGRITVSTVSLNENGGTAQKPIKFSVAIKDKKTNTLWMYTDKPVKDIDTKRLLDKCNSGDKIIIMTTHRIYSLMHNEIEIMKGC